MNRRHGQVVEFVNRETIVRSERLKDNGRMTDNEKIVFDY